MEFTKIISSPVFPCSAPDIGLTVENAGPITLKVSTASNTWEVQLSPVQSETGSSSGKKGQVTIRLRDILASIAKAPDLADNNLTSRTPFLSVNLSASNAAGEQDSMDIQVAYGNLTGKNPEDFLGHWLTTREQISRTYSWARERLSLLFGPKLLRWTGSVTLSVKCTAYLMSGQKRTVELASTSSEEDVYYSVDCSYNTISALIEDIGLAAWDLTYTLNGIDAYGEPAVLESYPQRFILAYQDSRVKEFLFTNRFGLEDRIFAEGISKKKIDGSSSTFANGGKLAELRNNAETVYEAFSGQLSDKRAVFHWHDFLSSANRMVVDADDTAIGIVVDSYDSETEDYSVGGISFNYRLSVKNSAFPDELYGSLGDYDPHEQFGALWVNQNPQAVTPEEEDLFFLRHRLSEFQALDVSDTLLLLVQCPLTDAWGSVSFENLKIWLKSVFDKEKKDIRLNALSDYETDDGNVIIPADLPNGSIPVWNSAAGAYRPVRASDLGQFGGFDKEYLWQILGTDSGEQINISHLPIKEIATALIKAGYKLTDSFHEYFGIDANKDIYVKDNRGLWSNSFLSSKGSDPEAGSGSGGIDVDTLWQILGTATSEQINVSHIPSLSIDKISGLQTALNSKLEAITKEMVETVLTGTITSHNHSGQYAPLSGGLIPSQYLPSFVDDVLEYPSKSAFPASGESGKIYVAADTNLTYRWSGTAYVEISPSLALGHTSSTAYPGDEGLANTQAIATLQGYFSNGAAKKVANALTIVHDGGNASAANKTYNGSVAVTVNIPTTLPASDVYDWAKQPEKPSYNFSEIGNKPNTLEGYGITDGVNEVTANNNLSGSINEHSLTIGIKSGYALPSSTQIALWDKICALFGIDTDGNVYVTNNKGFYSNSFISAKGTDSEADGGSGAGINEDDLWTILGRASDNLIDESHIPSIGTSKVTGLDTSLSALSSSISTNASAIQGNTAKISTLEAYFTNGVANNADMLKTDVLYGGDLNDIKTEGKLYYATGSNSVTSKPSGVDAFGMMSLRTAAGWFGQLLMSSNTATGLYWRSQLTYTEDGWRKILDSKNYTDYTVSKTGSGASGTWPISITGNAATASKLGTSTVGGTAQGIYLKGGTATALSATVGSAVQPVYMKNGVITAGTYAFGNASGNAALNNGTRNANLNADMLDSYHAESFVRRICNSIYATGSKPSIRLFRFTRGCDKGWIRLSIGDCNNAARGIVADYTISWGYTTSTDKSTWDISLGCNYCARADVSTALSAVRVEGATFDIYYTPNSTASTVSAYLTGYGFPSDASIDDTTAIVSQKTEADYTSSLSMDVHINASTLNGYSVVNGQNPFGKISKINDDGVTELGRYIDFHYDNTGRSDYDIRLEVPNVQTKNITLPSKSGTLALISDNVASATKLATARTLWGQSFDGTANVSGKMARMLGFYTNNDGKWSDGTNEHYWYGYDTNHNTGVFSTTISDYFGMCLRTGQGYLSMLSNGNVGIGTTTPSYKLHVAGSGYFSGAFSLASTLTTQGLATLNGGVKTNIITLVNGDKTANISLDADGNIHATAGLYSDSFLSAKGKDSEAGSTGEASYLPEITISKLPKGQNVTLTQLAAAGFTEEVIADMQSGKVTHIKAKYTLGAIEIWPVQGAGDNFFIVGYECQSPSYMDMMEWYEVSNLGNDGQIVAEFFER